MQLKMAPPRQEWGGGGDSEGKMVDEGEPRGKRGLFHTGVVAFVLLGPCVPDSAPKGWPGGATRSFRGRSALEPIRSWYDCIFGAARY